jgi:ABC-type Fe3+ transport system permease subunit
VRDDPSMRSTPTEKIGRGLFALAVTLSRAACAFGPIVFCLTAVVVLRSAPDHGISAAARIFLESLESAALWATTITALSAAAISTAIGAMLAPVCTGRGRRALAETARLFLLAAILSPIFLPQAAIGGVIAHMTSIGPAPTPGLVSPILRWSALCLTWVVATLPWSVLFSAWADRSTGDAEKKSTAILLAPRARLLIVLLRKRRAIATLLLVLFSAMFADLATPPHFGVETIGSKASWEFQTTLDPFASLTILLPFWLMSALLIALMPESGNDRTAGSSWVGRPPILRAIVTAVVVFVGPLLGAAHTAGEIFSPTGVVDRLRDPAAESLATAMIGAVFAATAALISSADELARIGKRTRAVDRWGTFSIALLVFCPGLLSGFLWASTAGFFPAIDRDLFFWVAVFQTTAVWGAVAAWALPLDDADRAGAALGLSPWRRFAASLSGSSGNRAVVAAFLGGAAAMRDIDLSSGFVRPGGETLAVRLAQGLHFGFRPETAEIAAGLQIAAYLSAVLFLVVGRMKGGRRGSD